MSSFKGGVEDLSTSQEMLERVLMIREECNGKEHVAVARVLYNLGNACGDLGDPTKQKELLERALKINEKHYGQHHFYVAMDVDRRWATPTTSSKTTPRRRMSTSAHLMIKERHFGPDHFDSGDHVDQPGQRLRRSGRPAEEEEALGGAPS